MKAIACTKYGSPDVLKVIDIPKPIPKDNEVLVKIVATAVNSGDVRVRGLIVQGLMRVVMRLILGLSKPRNSILGTVYSGVIENVGKNVSNFKVGDKVFGMTGFSFGTYAEYITVKQNGNINNMPLNANFEEAASIIFGGHTAIHFLEKLNLSQKDILIIGGTGSVGIAAIQIAKYYGANVSVVCSSSGKGLIEGLSVEEIFLYDKEDFTKIEKKFDVIFDAVGKSNKKECRKILKEGGIFKTVEGGEVAFGTKKQLELMKKFFENGKLKAVIDKVFEFEDVINAHKYVESGRKKGNVILKIN